MQREERLARHREYSHRKHANIADDEGQRILNLQ